MNAKPRYEYLDVITGLLIIHMIIGHTLQWGGLYNKGTFYDPVCQALFFFMPWFAALHIKTHNTASQSRHNVSGAISGAGGNRGDNTLNNIMAAETHTRLVARGGRNNQEIKSE